MTTLSSLLTPPATRVAINVTMLTIRGAATLLGIALLSLAPGRAAPDSPPAPSPTTIRAAIEPSAAPFSSVDASNQPIGLAVDLLNAVAKDRNLTVAYIVLPWPELLTQFEAGKIDVIANIAWQPERTGFADFTVPHAHVPGSIFIGSKTPSIGSIADLRGLRLAVLREGIGHTFARRHQLDSRLVLTNTVEEALAAVDSGRADATFAARIVGQKIIRDLHLENVIAATLEPAELAYDLHMAVRPGDTRLLATLNHGLYEIQRSGLHSSIYEKWLGTMEPRRLRWRDFDPYRGPALAIGLVLAFAFFFQRRLLGRLRRQTAELKTSQERLQLVLEGSEDAFWDWDVTNGRVNRSERWAGILGCKPEDIAPQVDACRPLTHPDDLERVEQSKRQIIRDGHGRVEYRLRATDGNWRWIFDRGKVVARDSDGKPVRVTGAASDITIRKRIEEVLVRSQSLLEQTQQAAEMGGWEYDLSNRSLYWTKETYRIHDLSPDEGPLTEERAFNFFPPHGQTILRAAYERAIEDKLPFDLELELVTARSRLVWVRFIGRVDHAGGQAVRLYGSVQDITQRKRTEEDRQKLQLKMLEAQKLESLGVLAGGIAHDFNNILTVILGNASLAREAPELTKDAIEHIETASNRAADLCRQMLAYAGKSRFTLETLDLNAVVEDTVHLLKLSISKNAALEFGLSPGPLSVQADASQVRQVIMNLVINASDSLGDGAGRIRISTSFRRVTREILRDARLGLDAPEGEYVAIEIEDNGCGMSTETTARIFDPFFTTKFTGRGLGLAAVLGIVRAHKGAFFVRSTLGKGSVFSMLLPRSKTEAVVSPEEQTRFPVTTRGEGSILVVDDEPHVRKVASAILEKQGYTVAVASDGYEALALALAHGLRFRAILLDLTMPGLDGPSTLREFRALSKTVPVLIMSGYSEADARKHFANDPYVSFLPKPFAAEDLLKRLYQLLNRPAPIAPAADSN